MFYGMAQKTLLGSDLFILSLFIFFRGKENEPKETARVPLPPARRVIERVSRKLAALKQAREPNPPDNAMLGAGQREAQAPFVIAYS